MKKFYFLSGYSRSGNTVLSSLLNQNKNYNFNSSADDMNEHLMSIEKCLIKNLTPRGL